MRVAGGFGTSIEDGVPATTARMTPSGVAVTRDGGFVISDRNRSVVQYVDAGMSFGKEPSEPGAPGLAGPAGAPGPQGAPAPSPAPPFERLVIAPVDDRIRVTAKKSLTLRYVPRAALSLRPG